MTSEFIDVFCSLSDRAAAYRANVWQKGRVVECVSHQSLEQTIGYCMQHNMPIISSDSQLLSQLQTHGVNATPPAARALAGLE